MKMNSFIAGICLFFLCGFLHMAQNKSGRFLHPAKGAEKGDAAGDL